MIGVAKQIFRYKGYSGAGKLKRLYNCVGEGGVKITPRILFSDAQSVLCGTIQGRVLEECQFEGGGNERERKLLCRIEFFLFVCFSFSWKCQAGIWIHWKLEFR